MAHEMVMAQAEVGQAAEAPATETTPPPGLLGGPWVMIVAFVAIIYFLMIRPNMQHEKKRREMLGALSKGDVVVTTGGIHGTIIGLNEQTVTLRVSDEPVVKLKFARAAITGVSPEEAGKKD
jgi:preprotein translocase subunit YajC